MNIIRNNFVYQKKITRPCSRNATPIKINRNIYSSRKRSLKKHFKTITENLHPINNKDNNYIDKSNKKKLKSSSSQANLLDIIRRIYIDKDKDGNKFKEEEEKEEEEKEEEEKEEEEEDDEEEDNEDENTFRVKKLKNLKSFSHLLNEETNSDHIKIGKKSGNIINWKKIIKKLTFPYKKEQKRNDKIKKDLENKEKEFEKINEENRILKNEKEEKNYRKFEKKYKKRWCYK